MSHEILLNDEEHLCPLCGEEMTRTGIMYVWNQEEGKSEDVEETYKCIPCIEEEQTRRNEANGLTNGFLFGLAKRSIIQWCETTDSEYSCYEDKDTCKNCMQDVFDLTDEQFDLLELQSKRVFNPLNKGGDIFE